MKDCLERWVFWTLKVPRGVPSPRVAIMKEKLVLTLPSGIHWNIKGLSQEPLWAEAISTDMTFGCQWQFYDSLYSCDQNRDAEMIPLPLRRRKLVSQSEWARNHTPLSSSWLSEAPARWHGGSCIPLPRPPFFSAYRLIAYGKCCVQISRAIESCVLPNVHLFFFLLFFSPSPPPRLSLPLSLSLYLSLPSPPSVSLKG